MSEETKQLTIQDNNGFMVVNTLEDALKVSEIIARSSFCPKQFAGKPGDVLVCMQMGMELGLKPLQSLQNIAVINGRPSLWGDAMLAVCRKASNFEYVDESFDEKTKTATCRAKRYNEPEVVRTFSEADARAAGLLGKQGVWSQYKNRMLSMRARGFCLRDTFADVLRGIITKEEAEDYPVEKQDYSHVIGDTVEGERVETINVTQTEELQQKMLEADSKLDAILKFAGIEELSDMTVTQYSNIMTMLNKKLSREIKSNIMRDLVANKSTPEIDENEHDDFHAELGEVNIETGEIN